jgi:anti-sigma regulatory factor (Ser/Thr protein kinase)
MAIRNRREDLSRVTAAVDRFAAECHLVPDATTDLQVALSEILTNIVDYAYTDAAEHWISIQLCIMGDMLEATIEDDGIPFDPLDKGVPDLRAPLRERRVGGLGILFVKTLMSEAKYERVGGQNRLVLRRKLGI